MDRYAVFGNPVAHSKSPLIHAQFAAQTGEAMSYGKQLVAEGEFKSAAGQFFSQGGNGLNITVPFKLDAYEYADQLRKRARQAGAVNTLIKQPDGTVVGDNTDGVGLVTDIEKNLGWPIKNKHLLVLGAGGAVRGVLAPLLACEPAQLVVLNRTAEKAQQLATAFKNAGNIVGCGYDDFQQNLSGTHFDIVINGTAASLAGDLPPLPDNIVGADSACYDMMYGKNDTVFMQWARQQGVERVADGLGMLVEQAAESFYLWRAKRVDTAPVIQSVRAALST